MSNIDPKHIGVPNICFSITNASDGREPDFAKQRIERGFDDSETWSLRDTIARFIVPRLERYIEIQEGMQNRDEVHLNSAKDFLLSMKLTCRDKGVCIFTLEEQHHVKSGIEAFPDIFWSLWW